MKWLRRLIRWPALGRDDRTLAEEIEQHRALVQADLERRGVPPREAAAASRRVMGNMRSAREDARDIWIGAWVDRLSRDVRYGVRGLRREPTFALTAILTIALGVATTTTVFSVVDAEVWKPLPFPEPDRLVSVYSRGGGGRGMVDANPVGDVHRWLESAPAFADLTGRGRTSRQILRRQTAESVLVTEVMTNYFALLGRPAVAGRLLADEDARGGRVALLTDRAWRRLFNRDASVVGSIVTLDGEPVVVAGVVRTDDSLGPDPDVFLALAEDGGAVNRQDPPIVYGAIGRLRPGADVAVARVQMVAVASRLAAEANRNTDDDHRIFVDGLHDHYATSNWRPLYFFLGASLLVLLLSAVNVATLLVGRAIRRTREFALRGALGGGQPALARQLLVESVVLALPGAIGGIGLAAWAIGIFSSNLPADFLQHGDRIPIDARVCAFALAVAGATTIAFALAPLVLTRRIDLAGVLGAGVRAGHSKAEGSMRSVLLAAQIALTVILLSGAGLFLKSFVALTRVPLGFEPANALTVRASLSGPRYAADAPVRAYADDLVERARATPGVRAAAICSTSPLGSGPMVFFTRSGQPAPAPGQAPRAILRAASPGYFRTLGIHLAAGRDFLPGDGPGAPRVAIVNESIVRRVFGGDSPLGHDIELLPGARVPWTNRPGVRRVIGVVANVKEVGVNEIEFLDVYVPFAQVPSPWVELVVRADGPPEGLRGPLRQSAAEIDSFVPVTGVSTFDERVREALQSDRFNLVLIVGFAAVAMLLASIGVYGTVAYSVQARTREFGVRLALGARPSRLIAGALWRVGRLSVLGGVAGVSGALALAALLGDALYLVPGSHNGLLFGVSTADPSMLAAAFGGIVLVAVGAGAIPARRVSRVDPVRALQSE